MLKTKPQVVLYKLWCKYIHLFCLEQGAASCFLLFAALPPPAVDTESPEGHAHQELLSPHQKHQLPATAEGKQLKMTPVLHFCCVISKWSASVTLFNSEQRCLFEFLSTAFCFLEFFLPSSCGYTPNKNKVKTTTNAQQRKQMEDLWCF